MVRIKEKCLFLFPSLSYPYVSTSLSRSGVRVEKRHDKGVLQSLPRQPEEFTRVEDVLFKEDGTVPQLQARPVNKEDLLFIGQNVYVPLFPSSSGVPVSSPDHGLSGLFLLVRHMSRFH